jgi:tRNA(His) guanylyltransferase
MACSKFEYVKKFEKHEELLPQTYIVVRIDGKGFTKFCERHKLKKPNDMRLVDLMNSSALYVMNMFKDIFMAYGQSDEYSFAFKRDT